MIFWPPPTHRLLTRTFRDEPPVQAAPERLRSGYKPLDTFVLPKDRQYQQQYGDMYFLRLTKIKPAVEQVASAAFGDVIIGGEPAQKVERVLDVRQGELCWITGTVYMDMPLKPNILEDVAKDVSSMPSRESHPRPMGFSANVSSLFPCQTALDIRSVFDPKVSFRGRAGCCLAGGRFWSSAAGRRRSREHSPRYRLYRRRDRHRKRQRGFRGHRCEISRSRTSA